ncbi:MAG: hypothetical protein EXX96DRAFT_609262 [Benjaminiella poitrasii]|nr:MAG: hypothetical protein EXX96DRAFT_609262 [Benjaminiella poitrasii]
MSEQASTENKPIITHCIEHAATGLSKCTDCGKGIAIKSLRVAEIYRKSKKVKKTQAKHTWYHFKCWKVPEYLTHVPIEQFRGYPALNDKDKKRVQKVIEGGVGASWTALMEKEKAAAEEEEGNAEKETKSEVTKQKTEDDMDFDLTESLTGIQEKEKPKKKEIKKKSNNNNNKTTNDNKKKAVPTTKKDALKPKKAKITKPTPAPTKPKEITLPKEDLLELEKFAKEFSAVKEKK